MGKRKFKRSMASLPKGLPQRGKHASDNPFESGTRQQKRPKHEVHNRNISNNNNNKQSALARSLKRRQDSLKSHLQSAKKSNSFVDRRIGEYTMTREEKDLARIVRERSRRSKKSAKFSLNDEDEGGAELLTHKGKAIDDLDARDHVLLSSDDEDDRGDLEAIDTELHFGGGNIRSSQNPYGPAGADNDQSMAQVYSQRKTELDDLIARRKILKAERIKSRETQVEAFETMDESFKELASLLKFRDKEQERKDRLDKKRQGTMSEQEREMEEWNKEMKEYLFERKVKATDRTKTAEEIAAEEAERLQELETKRLARMNGDFENDDLSDISEDESDVKSKQTRKKKKSTKSRSGDRNPEELEDEGLNADKDNDGLEARFTADGLVYVDKSGRVVKKMGEEDEEGDDEQSPDDDSDSESEDSTSDSDIEGVNEAGSALLTVGTRVQGSYRVKEQYENQESWYDGIITKVNKAKDGAVTYDVTYDDGDYEYDMEPENVKAIQKTSKEKQDEKNQKHEDMIEKRKRQKAKEKARQEIPFVFEVPTTLEALHDMIGTYASTGADASLIIQRIHKSNSVRLDKRNTEKMQNFYDVLLRRFIAVGDAIFTSGDGGSELGRFSQLDALTQTLYAMSQDSPSCAGAVWGRRLGIFQNALAKRLRDAEFVGDEDDEEEESAWFSTGTFLLLRCLGHIFPVTDLRHHVVTPALLLLGQTISQTPVRSIHDLVLGVLCAGLMIEYTKEAMRIAPEALAFLAGALRLFAPDPRTATHPFPIPNLEVSCSMPLFQNLRESVTNVDAYIERPKLSLQQDKLDDQCTPAAILCSVLELVKDLANHLGGNLNQTEIEVFAEVSQSLLLLKPNSKKKPLPSIISELVVEAAVAVSNACKQSASRKPLMRRSGPSVSERAIKTFAPKMEDPSRYALSKDKGKSAMQAAIDRTRREYKREHKAVARELRLDAAFIEDERRKEKARKDAAEREKRNKNFAWLEGEQAAMNQQVRLGGGLLSGGGTGAARAKVKTAKLGIKKGGKFR